MLVDEEKARMQTTLESIRKTLLKTKQKPRTRKMNTQASMTT